MTIFCLWEVGAFKDSNVFFFPPHFTKESAFKEVKKKIPNAATILEFYQV